MVRTVTEEGCEGLEGPSIRLIRTIGGGNRQLARIWKDNSRYYITLHNPPTFNKIESLSHTDQEKYARCIASVLIYGKVHKEDYKPAKRSFMQRLGDMI